MNALKHLHENSTSASSIKFPQSNFTINTNTSVAAPDSSSFNRIRDTANSAVNLQNLKPVIQ